MVLTQTTLNMFEVEKLFKKIKREFPGARFPSKKDLCYTTTTRQKSVLKNARKCDLFLVVGSINSSNSKKLREIAESAGAKAYLIDNYQEIDEAWLTGSGRICLTSGASAPDYLVEEIINFLTKKHNYIFSEH
jgi:4-hydroxy-3-methylbut-2-enyl diphosphate reductase